MIPRTPYIRSMDRARFRKCYLIPIYAFKNCQQTVHQLAESIGVSDLDFFRADPNSKQAFVAGYQQIRPLLEFEQQAIPAFEAARHIFSLGVPAAHINEWGRARLTDRLVAALLDHIRDRIGCVS